ncbi:dimethylsulfonioproprionate lyase family protein [Amaricoccus sp.]|uniref:dimethylsulfonioproprionate lyase family protein n=1 Tax=Amaricoccus sp. TaxID=1872485 RepID=UPI002618D324|nr:dimethylsulfonioproprionate lyase family protein [uncultured Amaricoccus sp.]
MPRDPELQVFVDAAIAAFAEAAPCPEARASLRRIATALASSAPRRERPGSQLPVCSHLEGALAVDPGRPSLRRLVAAFRAIEPDLEWVRRASYDGTASANFVDGHANTMILGPAGLENRTDVWFGASLLAPRVRYTDHSHAPEETYLVLSPGEFRQGDGDWFTPGVGGSFYNVPFVTHAMKSGDAPLFALWALWVEASR